MPARATHLFGAVLLGGAAVLLGLPAQAQALTLQLEGGSFTGPVKVVQDRAAGGGRAVALTGQGVVRHRFTTTALASAVELRVRALPCVGTRPRIVLRLDGRAIGARAVPSRRFTRVQFRASARGGPHTAALRLANPGRVRATETGPGADRGSPAGRGGPSRRPAGPRGRLQQPGVRLTRGP